MLADAAGNPLYAWDPDNREFHFAYDELRRPLSKLLTISSTTYQIEETIYGEGMTGDTDKNLRGQVHTHRDNAGESRVPEYDFKGLPKETQQQLLLDFRLVHVDWASGPTLDSEIFISTVVFDALGRPISSMDPGMNLTENVYDKGGALCEVKLTPNGGSQSTYISDIHYDAKGQRLAIWYGNGTRTAYTYDPNNFRLQRLLTSAGGNIYYQDLNYWYDAVGNITWVTDNAEEDLYYNPPPGSPLSDAKRYTYDTLYRLIQATGLERQGSASFGSSDNTDDAPWMAVHPMDPSAMQTYTQQYLYDAVGNILQLQHVGATVGSYTRNYAYGSGNSKLNSTQIGATNYPYTYDSRGNMLTMPHLSTMDWNGLNELQHTGNGTVDTYFNYSGGQRIRKVCLKAGGIEEQRIYLGSYEIYRKFVSSSLTQERLTVHVHDDTGRIAMVETETTTTPDTRVRYVYSNHLQSATLELDDSCAIISYEEYHPFGTTAFQSSDSAINAVAKRYRYTGKERDEETGLYYHGARYYIPWLARWSACDPINSEVYNWGKGDPEKNIERHFTELSASSYEYCYDNPVRFTDPTGEQVPNIWQSVTLRDEVNYLRIKTESRIKNWQTSFENKKANTVSDLLYQAALQYDKNVGSYSEAQKKEVFKKSAQGTVAILLYEMSTGTGPQTRNFYYGRDMYATELVNGSRSDRPIPDALSYIIPWANMSSERNITKEITNKLYQLISDGNLDFSTLLQNKGTESPIGLSFSPDQTNIFSSFQKHLESNLSQLFMGGAIAYISADSENSITVRLYNKTSLSSGSFRLVKDREDKGEFRRSGSSVEQNIYFRIENLDTKKLNQSTNGQ